MFLSHVQRILMFLSHVQRIFMFLSHVQRILMFTRMFTMLSFAQLWTKAIFYTLAVNKRPNQVGSEAGLDM